MIHSILFRLCGGCALALVFLMAVIDRRVQADEGDPPIAFNCTSNCDCKGKVENDPCNKEPFIKGCDDPKVCICTEVVGLTCVPKH